MAGAAVPDSGAVSAIWLQREQYAAPVAARRSARGCPARESSRPALSTGGLSAS
jgi:hypothetical protein